MAALKKKKAVPVAGTAFKYGPDCTGLNAKHYIGVPNESYLLYPH